MDSLKAKLAGLQRSGVGLFFKKVMDDQAPNLAALLAWGTLSAILPLMLGVLSIAGLVLRDQQRVDQLYNTLTSAMPSAAAGPVTDVLNSMREGSAAPAGIVAIVLLLVNGSSFFSNMASVFNQVYHVEGRNMIVERIIALVMLLLTTTLLVLSTLAAGLTGLVTHLPGFLPIGPVLGQVAGWSVSILSVIILFLLIYRALPHGRQGWRDVVPGALLSSFLLLLISQIFPLYVSLFPPNHAYAIFGVFLVFTFYLYVLGWVFVLGAELNAYLQQPARSVALAEATAAAERGRADYDEETGAIRAEAQGRSPAMQAPAPLGTRPRSVNEQLREQGEGGPSNGNERDTRDRSPRVGLGGRIIGFAGLIVAALLLRGRGATA